MSLQKIASPNKVPEIRKGDTVVVMHGKDAGKRGKVDRVIRNTTGEDRGTGTGSARDEEDDEEIEQCPLALGEIVTPGQEEPGRGRDGQQGKPVAVTGKAR